MSDIAKLNQSRWINSLIFDCGQVEVRHQQGKYFQAGIFTSADLILELFDQYQSGNLYSSINKFHPRHVTNQISQRKGMVGNNDVVEIRRIFFDFDAVREKGMAATNSQLEDAKARCRDFNRDMKGRGWPSPAIGMSGNGAHLMYRCKLRPEAEKYLKRLYRILSERYSDPLVIFDQCVFNPGRITRLYGSINRKGIASEHLPHRQSEIEVPSSYECVSSMDVWKFIQAQGADVKPSRPPPTGRIGQRVSAQGAGDYQTLDIVGWSKAVGIYVSPDSLGRHHVICPWKHEHSDQHAAAMIFENLGSYPGFNCFHEHCADRDLFELIDKLGGADEFCRNEFQRTATG